MNYAGRYNPEALATMLLAECAYLQANGWKPSDLQNGPGNYWTHPTGLVCLWGSHPTAPTMKAYPGSTNHKHAVNAQRLFDSRCASYVAEVRASLGLDTLPKKG